MKRKVTKKAINESSFVKGNKYFVRTVTYHAIGIFDKIEMIGRVPFAVFDKASWVADSGRFGDCLKDGISKQSPSEVEPFPKKLRINLAAITEFTDYDHDDYYIQK